VDADKPPGLDARFWRRHRVRFPCRRTGNKLEIERCQKGAL